MSTRRITAIALLTVAAFTGCSKGAASQVEQTNAPADRPQDGNKNAQAEAASPTSDRQTVSVVANEDGFTPNHIEFKRQTKATLQFRRTTDHTCANEVVFPELGITKSLPLNQNVEVEIPIDQPKTLTFQCGMGMYKSKVVVLP